MGGEEFEGFFGGLIEYLGDVATAIFDFEGLAVVAFAGTGFARDIDVGEEMHFDFLDAFAGARFAAATFDIETKSPCLVPAELGLGGGGEEIADVGEDSCVGGRITLGRAADATLVDDNGFVEMLDAEDGLGGAADVFGTIELGEEFAGEDGIDEAALPTAGYAGYADEAAKRDVDGEVLEVVLCCIYNLDLLTTPLPALCGHVDRLTPGEVGAGDAVWVGHELLRGALADDLTAVLTGSWPYVDEVVGATHDVFVVLDDEDGIAEVAELFESFDEFVIVPLVEADRWFVEDIEDALELTADLGGKADALGFAAAQGIGRAVQREIRQADIVQESKPGVDFLEDEAGYFEFGGIEFETFEKGLSFFYIHLGDFDDGGGADPYAECFGAEACTVAAVAGLLEHELFELLADPFALGFAVAPLDIGEYAFEFGGVFTGDFAAGEGDFVHFVFGAVEDDVVGFFTELIPRGVEAEVVLRGYCLEDIGIPSIGTEIRPGGDGAFFYREADTRDDTLLVHRYNGAEAVTGGTGAVRGIEREHAGRELGNAETAHGAGEALGVSLGIFGIFGIGYCDDAVAVLQTELDTVGEARAVGVVFFYLAAALELGDESAKILYDETIDDDFDGVLLLGVELGVFGDGDDGAVHAIANEAVFFDLFDEGGVFAFPIDDDGG